MDESVQLQNGTLARGRAALTNSHRLAAFQSAAPGDSARSPRPSPAARCRRVLTSPPPLTWMGPPLSRHSPDKGRAGRCGLNGSSRWRL